MPDSKRLSKGIVNNANTLLLMMALAYVILNHVGLHQSAHSDSGSQELVQWSQPNDLNEKYPLLIADNNWQFDFKRLEIILWNAKVNEAGDLLINSDTEDMLQRASDQIPASISSENLQRLLFLTQKSLPGSNGDKLSRLLGQYHAYQQDHKENLSIINKATENEKPLLLKTNLLNYKLRQVHYFGVDLAERLFSKKNITTDYINKRRLINMDGDLTKTQKEQQLSALSNKYKNALNR